MENKITSRGFYLLLGMIIGAFITYYSLPEPTPQPVKIEVTNKDSIKVDSIPKKQLSKLTEKNLKAELAEKKVPHAEIVLAQAKLETGNFNSKVLKTHQNLFGLRKGSKYRRYNHWSESVDDYKKHISNRYRGGDYYAFLNRIGYAEDPNYIRKLKEFV